MKKGGGGHFLLCLLNPTVGILSNEEFQSHQVSPVPLIWIQICFLGPEDSNHKSGQYFCDECDVNFDKSTAYARHLYAHTFIKKAPLIYCVSTFKEGGPGGGGQKMAIFAYFQH